MPGWPGQQVRGKIFTILDSCAGICPPSKLYYIEFERVRTAVERTCHYERDCDPVTDCVYTGERRHFGWLISECVCSETEPTRSGDLASSSLQGDT